MFGIMQFLLWLKCSIWAKRASHQIFVGSKRNLGRWFKKLPCFARDNGTCINVRHFCSKGQAIGKKCQVPYLKGGFSVIGLPEGIPFKKPYNYGAHQIKKIMESDSS